MSMASRLIPLLAFGMSLLWQGCEIHDVNIPLNDKFSPGQIQTDFFYPDSVNLEVNVPDNAETPWKWDALTWPGRSQMEKQTLRLWMPEKNEDGASLLGAWEGQLVFEQNGDVQNIPFQVSRSFRNFAPDPKVGNYWDRSGEEWKITADSNFIALTAAVGGALEDSISLTRSLFSLRGGFSLETQLELPKNVISGYSVAFFLSPETDVTYFRIPGDPLGFSVLTPAVGVRIKGDLYGSQIAAFGFDSRLSNTGTIINQGAVLRLEKRLDSFVFSFREQDASEYKVFATFLYTPEQAATLPDSLYVHFALGNFNPLESDVSVTFKHFKITEGGLIF